MINQLVVAITMAASAGYRAFLPLFVLAFVSRTHIIDSHIISPFALDFLRNNPLALYILGGLALFEMVADKLSTLGSIIDAIYLFLRPIIGGIVVFCVINFNDNQYFNFLIAFVIGLMITLPTHRYISSVRMLSERPRAIKFNIVLSFVEDVIGLGFSILTLAFSYYALIIIPVISFLSVTSFSKWSQQIVQQEEIEAGVIQDFKGEDSVVVIKRLKKLKKK